MKKKKSRRAASALVLAERFALELEQYSRTGGETTSRSFDYFSRSRSNSHSSFRGGTILESDSDSCSGFCLC